MVDRGTEFKLFPDRYEKHAVLVEKLDRLRGWGVKPPEEPQEPEEPAPENETDGLLAHQLEAVNRIKQFHKHQEHQPESE